MKKLIALAALLGIWIFPSAQNVGIGTVTPQWKLDVRGGNPDDGQLISVGNSDQTHRILLFGGRQNDPNPFIQWIAGDPLRFATTESGFRELMRINSDGTVGINNFNPNGSAILDISSTSKGILIPRMNSTQRTGIVNPANGLLVFDNTTNSFWFYTGSSWSNLSAGSGWNITGNSNTTSANFLGTANKRSLQFKVNNVYAGALDTLDNVFIGTNAGQLDKSFSSVAIGSGAFKTAAGGEIVAIGVNSFSSNVNGIWNTAVGSFTLASHKTGNHNTAIGYAALDHDTAGISNTAVGSFAMTANRKGFNNNAFGSYVLSSNDSGNYNTGAGSGALFSNFGGHQNSAFGRRALYNNTFGNSNVAVGNWALHENTTKSFLVAIGDSALFSNGIGASDQEGIFNTAIGSKALMANTKGFYNTATGFNALRDNNTGSRNSAFGANSLVHTTSGVYNTAMGALTLSLNTIGANNTALGTEALYSNQSGDQNTGIGTFALNNNTTGSSNTAIGYNANTSTGDLANATAIGANTVVSASNSLVLGNNANVGIGVSAPVAKLHLQVSGTNAYAGIMISSTLAGGKSLTINQGTAGRLNFTNPGVIDLVTMDFNNNRVGINATFPSHLLQLGNDDAYKPSTSTWGVISDKRVKENIQPFTDGWNVLKNINPVWFDYNGTAGTHKGEKAIGTIAQELKMIAPYMVKETSIKDEQNNSSNYLGVNYHAMFFLLANALKDQNKLIEQLQQEVTALKAKVH